MATPRQSKPRGDLHRSLPARPGAPVRAVIDVSESLSCHVVRVRECHITQLKVIDHPPWIFLPFCCHILFAQYMITPVLQSVVAN